jgi:hypothetical protein
MQPKENKKSETKKPQITFTYNNNPAGNSNAGQSYVMKSNQNVSTPVYQNPTFQYQQLPNFNSYNAPNSYNNVAYNNLQ